MSDKKLVLEKQAELIKVQADNIKAAEQSLIKAQSLVDVITNSIEVKNKDNVLGIASELNSLISVYNELENGIGAIEEVLAAFGEAEAEDEANA